jgi:hypothetical protein
LPHFAITDSLNVLRGLRDGRGRKKDCYAKDRR